MKVHPVDHSFLNRVGIFRTLQTILDDSRTYLENRDLAESTDMLAQELLLKSNRRVVKLVLFIVYSLASQIAVVRAESVDVSVTTACVLEKIASGPDTLSKSLFSMLYNEMHLGIRGIMQRSCCMDVSREDNSVDETFGDNSTAELHVSRILKLLYLVSDSPVCHLMLISSKWLYLLLCSIGYGSLILQRRLFRLLRKLLNFVQPRHICFSIPTLVEEKLDVIENVVALDDDDISNMFLEHFQDVTPSDRGIEASKRIVKIFLDAIIIMVRFIFVDNLTVN